MVIVAAVTAAAMLTPTSSPPDGGRIQVSATDLVEVAEIGPPELSPDGRQVAYRVARPSVEANEVRLDWYVVDVESAASIHVGSGGTAQFEGSGALAEQQPVWDRDSRGLRFRARVAGAVGIWHWRHGEGLTLEITDRADIIDFALSSDGSAIRYSVGASREEIETAERAAYESGVLVDHRLDLMQPVAGGAIEDGARVMQRLPTEWFERERLLWDTPKRRITVAITAGDPHSPPIFQPGETKQGKKVRSRAGTIASIDRNGIRVAVRLVRANGEAVFCHAAVCRSPDLAALEWTADGEALLLFERAGAAREHVWLWTPAGKAAKLATTDGAERTTYRAPRCVAAVGALVCTESRPTSPPRVVRIGYRHGRQTSLADPNAGLRGRIRARVQWLPPEPGLTATLLLPEEAERPLPLVVQYYHCAGFLKGGVGDEIPMLPLVEHGIAVLCMDRRGRSGMPPSTPADVLGAADVAKMIDRLAASGTIDPRRVGIGGLSFGSEVTLAAIRHSRRFAAATIASGQITPIYYWANALPGRGFTDMLSRSWKLGDPDSDRARWKASLPTENADSISTPLLMQLPEAEARYMIEFHTKLKLAGRPVEMVVFPDEPHIKNQPVHKRAVYERNLDWFRYWLTGEKDRVAAKQEQYVRWEGYRRRQLASETAPPPDSDGATSVPVRQSENRVQATPSRCASSERTHRSMSAR